MAEAALRRMTVAEFLVWQPEQAELFELVDGRPVPRAMTGATQRHDILVVNALTALRQRLRGGRCRPTTSDVAVVSPGGNVRRPDLTVNCNPIDAGATEVAEPVMVLEVLSPSTASVDQYEKLEEYKSITSMRYVVLAEARRRHVILYLRGDDGAWTYRRLAGPDAVIELPVIGCALPLSELYEDVPLDDAA